MPDDRRFQFEEGEKVLCFHGPLLYEAKVLKAEYFEGRKGKEDGAYYFVHYRGWKASWDEWVPTARILRLDDEGLRRQTELREVQSAKKAAAKAPERSKSVVDTISDRSKKRRRDSMVDKEDVFMKRPEIKVTIPELLKSQLVEDWEMVTKNHKLVPLPRETTASQVLDQFRDAIRETLRKRTSREGRPDDSINEVVEGLKLYFDKALGNILLYRFERQQYAEIRQRFPDTPMSQIYGAEHLLRLFVQLPALIAHTNMDQDAVAILKDHFAQILAYLQKNHQQLFLEEYEQATPAYVTQMQRQ
ncbi:MRG-domain-containing protein [Entophlyctis helioformis]|nr:MRG-domain-containing protein [Entophlyctis helioformis]